MILKLTQNNDTFITNNIPCFLYFCGTTIIKWLIDHNVPRQWIATINMLLSFPTLWTLLESFVLVQRIFVQTPEVKNIKLILLQTWLLGSHKAIKKTLPPEKWGKCDFWPRPFLTVGIFGKKITVLIFGYARHDYTLNWLIFIWKIECNGYFLAKTITGLNSGPRPLYRGTFW